MHLVLVNVHVHTQSIIMVRLCDHVVYFDFEAFLRCTYIYSVDSYVCMACTCVFMKINDFDVNTFS